MRARTPIRLILALLAAVSVAAVASPVIGRSHAATSKVGSASAADLGAVVDGHGTFRGGQGVTGAVDAGAWNLVSDLTTGEAPRFARTARSSPSTASTPTGPWSGLGSNGSGDGALKTGVFAVAVMNHDLYVGGNFQNAAGIPEADYVAMWDGSSWSALGSDHAGNGALSGRVWALAVQGSTLFVGGDFSGVGGFNTADHIAQWDGGAWHAVVSSSASEPALNNTVRALAVMGGDAVRGGRLHRRRGPRHGRLPRQMGRIALVGSRFERQR